MATGQHMRPSTVNACAALACCLCNHLTPRAATGHSHVIGPGHMEIRTEFLDTELDSLTYMKIM